MINAYLTQRAPLPLRSAMQSLRIGRKAAGTVDVGVARPVQGAFGVDQFKRLSQNGEDGILHQIFSRIGVTDRQFCEFGFSSIECNSILLAEASGFGGLWIDGDRATCETARRVAQRRGWRGVEVVEAFITRDNIDTLLTPLAQRSRGVIDLLSVDIDGNDYWIFEAIRLLKGRVLVMEYNPAFGPDRDMTVPYVADFFRGKNGASPFYFGASLGALTKLAARRGYRLVGTDATGTNAFYVQDGLGEDVFPRVDVAAAFRPLRAWREQNVTMEDAFAVIEHLPLVDV